MLIATNYINYNEQHPIHMVNWSFWSRITSFSTMLIANNYINYNEQHPFHMVNVSPWPLFTSFSFGLPFSFKYFNPFMCFHLVVNSVSTSLVLRQNSNTNTLHSNSFNNCIFIVSFYNETEDSLDGLCWQAEVRIWVCTIVSMSIVGLPPELFDVALEAAQTNIVDALIFSSQFVSNLNSYYWFWDYSQEMDNRLYMSYWRWDTPSSEGNVGMANVTTRSVVANHNLLHVTYSNPYSGWPTNQYFYLVNHYNPSSGGIGSVIGIVDPIWRWVRINLNSENENQSLEMSFLLEFPATTMNNISVYPLAANHAHNMISVPVTRVGGFNCIDGIYCCNVIVPNEAYFYNVHTVRSRSWETAEGVPMPAVPTTMCDNILFEIDLNKLLVTEHTKCNIFRRKHAFFNSLGYS